MPGASEEIYTVSRLNRLIRNLVEDGIPPLWVEGEVSNYTRSSSGHRYFTLKDAEAQIRCTYWRTRPAPPFELRDGIQLRVFGKVTVWEKGGSYQIDVQSVMVAGMGTLQEAFEALKRKLAAEGLFDQSRKKSLPRFPRAIGLVTSETGAAIRDLTWGFSKRYPPAQLYLLPVAVQGETAATQIAAAIETFNRLRNVDVIVIGRGGGSIEDLWAFNEEIVVRAVAASDLPVVSAVGHEVDVTLSDLVADLRAPTPTSAAALIVPDAGELKRSLRDYRSNLLRALSRLAERWRERLQALRKGYGFAHLQNRVAGERLRLEELNQRIERILAQVIRNRSLRLESIAGRLQALSPLAVMQRGYSIARDAGGRLLRSSGGLKAGDPISIRFHKGGADVSVTKVIPDAG